MGKHTGYEASPERLTHPFQKTDTGIRHSWQMAASGLAGRLGEREHARSDLRCHAAQGDLCHHRFTHGGALLRWLGLTRPMISTAVSRRSAATRKASPWAAI